MAKAVSYLRMSTPEQIRGDSLRRQTELAQAYCRKHGLTLVENMKDIGISAFRGANAAEGALSEFLEAIEKKKTTITKGDFLLVESVDRPRLLLTVPLVWSLRSWIRSSMVWKARSRRARANGSGCSS